MKFFVLLNDLIELRIGFASGGVIADQRRRCHEDGFVFVRFFIGFTLADKDNGRLYTGTKMGKGTLRQAHNCKQLELLQDEIAYILRGAVCQNAVGKYDCRLAGSGLQELPNAFNKQYFGALSGTIFIFSFSVLCFT